jgi:hypothetical protein
MPWIFFMLMKRVPENLDNELVTPTVVLDTSPFTPLANPIAAFLASPSMMP